MAALPASFPKGASFLDVDGIPVVIRSGVGNLYCARFDGASPRAFDPASARRNGAPLSEAKFRALVASLTKAAS